MERARLQEKHAQLPGSELAALVTGVRERTLALVDDLDDEQLEVPRVEIVNPFRWELGHVACFYDAFLLRVLDDTPPVMAGSDDLYDSFDVAHGDRWSIPLPSRAATLRYMSDVLERVVQRLPGGQASAEETYLYGLAVRHEDMHREALIYMRQTLGYSRPAGELPASAGGGAHAGDVDIEGRTFALGAAPEDPFVFDNEKWAHPVEVAPFAIARAQVTHAEFAAFVDDGGYRRHELWSVKGRAWRAANEAEHPLYWVRTSGGWQRRDFDQLVALEEHAPVAHVSWYEAEAYCRWANRRLPTEAEWELAASGEPGTDRKRRYPWGDAPPTPQLANLDTLGCVEVSAHPAGDSAFGCRQMTGNVWEWTASPFYPFPGYLVDYPYREYSAPWFGDRQVLKGGAWATPSRLAYNTFRNFFPPGRNDVFAGFRTCAV